MTPHNPLVWIGLAGIAPDDNARARLWQQRLHWTMVGIALLALPAYLLDTAEQRSDWHGLATVLDSFILAAFLAETVWMGSITRLIDAEDLAFRTEFRKEIEGLREEIVALRAEAAQRAAHDSR